MVIEIPYKYQDAWGRERVTVLRYRREADPYTQHVRWTLLPGEWGAGRIPNGRPRVVAIGGGTGLPMVLRAVRRWMGDGVVGDGRAALTAIVAVSDDGGSSGALRATSQVTPPGDIRNCLLALAEDASPLSQIFQYRFEGGAGLAGHTLGNLFLAASAQVRTSFLEAVELAQRILGTSGRVLPCTLDEVRLRAEFLDGEVVEGETNIRRRGGRIRRLGLVPASPAALPAAVDAIARADLVVIGPGSLYTSLLAVLAVPDVARALRETPARRVLVLNLMTEPGETDGFTGPDHLRILDDHLGARAVDAVLANNGEFSPDVVARYAAQSAHPVPTEEGGFREMGVPLFQAPLAAPQDAARHDPEPLAAALARCFGAAPGS